MAAAAQTLDYLCVLDYEAVCEDGVRLSPQEIIEWPTVLFHIRTNTIVAEFHTYVRPEVHPVTPFCTQLTGITPAMVSDAPHFPAVVSAHLAWLRAQSLDPDQPAREGARYAYVTCGDWDLKTCLPAVMKHHGIPTPAGLRQWINLKHAFPDVYRGMRPRGMTEMLDHLGLQLEGRHHSGIDDARNIARVAMRMLASGWAPRITASLR